MFKIHKTNRDPALKSPWDFYGYGKPIHPESSATVLTDTIMDGIKYKRIRTYATYLKNSKTDTSFLIYYANCNATHSMFQFDISLSKKFANGCPIQMQDYYWTSSSNKLRLKYDFTRDTLTPYEHKVFDAWEKYVIEHPIKE